MNLKKSKLFKESRIFDASEFLDNDEVIFEYLKLAFKSKDDRQILMAINDVLKAKRLMSKTAKKIKVDRSGLCKSLSKNGNPYFSTINKLIQSLGMELSLNLKKAS